MVLLRYHAHSTIFRQNWPLAALTLGGGLLDRETLLVEALVFRTYLLRMSQDTFLSVTLR